MTIRVHSATRDDAAAWLRLRHELWPEEDGGDSHRGEIDQYFAGTLGMPLEVLIAADDSGAAVGFAELSIRGYAEDCLTDRIAYLEGWYVAPSQRRTGVGAALVRAAEEWGRRQGCTEFASDALIDNEVSAVAHIALGFEETGQIRCFRKPLPGATDAPDREAHQADASALTDDPGALSRQIASSLSDHYERVRGKIHSLVAPLSTDQLWTRPYPYGNSIGHLLLHLSGNLNYYIGTQIAGTGYVRDRPKEFADTSKAPVAATLEQFDRAIDMVRATLAEQTAGDWRAPYHGVGSEDVKDRLGIFVRCAAHVDHHLGQVIYLAKELARA